MNWELIGYAAVVTVAPLPIIAFLLVLTSARGTVKGLAFIAGWILSLLVVAGVTLALTGGRPPRPGTAPRAVVSWLVLGLGVGLIAYGLRRWAVIRNGTAAPPSQPAWVARLDGMPVWACAGLGMLVQPWPFVGAAAASVTELDLSRPEAVLSLIGYLLIGSASLLVMEGYALVAHARAVARLGHLRTWLDDHRPLMVAVLAVALGTALVVKGLAGVA